jgi:hypothetical protein
MSGDGCRLKVIHSCAAKGAVGGWKPRGLDDVCPDSEAPAQAQYRPGILRNVGLVKGKTHRAADLIFPSR